MSRSLSSPPTLTDRIAADLRAHAVAGLPLPAPLTLAGLAAHYGVSLTPIRRAAAALVEEGVLRRHMINEDGSPRDSVFYSILADEWPTVKHRLEERLRGR